MTETTTPTTDTTDAVEPQAARSRAALAGVAVACVVIALALSTVIISPIALSSQDLVRWASDPTGLGLGGAWAWLVFIALDSAAAVCIGMVTFAAWKGEPGGAFHALTWLFALGSAAANYRHGITTPARDDQYFFPAMSIAGPALLDVTLARIRRWVRVGNGTQIVARPRFGLRWLPGVGFRETLAAWRAALREDIARPADAIAHVREVRALAGLAPADALRFAWQALGHTDPYVAWQWLVARDVTIDQATVNEAAARATQTPGPVQSSPGRDLTGPAEDSGLARPEPGPGDAGVVPLRSVARATAGRGPARPARPARANRRPGPGQADPLWPDALTVARALRSAGRDITRGSIQAGVLEATGHSLGNGRADRLRDMTREAIREERGSGAPAGRQVSDG
jgi:hypothetical protein